MRSTQIHKLFPLLLALSLFSANATAATIHQLAKSGDLTGLQKRLSSHSNVDQTDRDGTTPLMYAAAFGHTKMVEWLLSRNADIHKRDRDGVNALMYSVSIINKQEVIDLLLKKAPRLSSVTRRVCRP